MRFQDLEVSNSAEIHKKRGEHVKAFQDRHGLSNKEVAEILHCSESRVSQMRYGKRPVVTEDAERLAGRFPEEGIRPEYFLCIGQFPDCMTEQEVREYRRGYEEGRAEGERAFLEVCKIFAKESGCEEYLEKAMGLGVDLLSDGEVTFMPPKLDRLWETILLVPNEHHCTDDDVEKANRIKQGLLNDTRKQVRIYDEQNTLISTLTYEDWSVFSERLYSIVKSFADMFVEAHKPTEEELKEWQALQEKDS